MLTRIINSGYKQAFCGKINVGKDVPDKTVMENAYKQNRSFLDFPHDTMVHMGANPEGKAIKFQTYVPDKSGKPCLIEKIVGISELKSRNLLREMCDHVLHAIQQKNIMKSRHF